MPCLVKIHFKHAYTAVTVSDGHIPYTDTHGLLLDKLNVVAGAMYEISVPLIHGVGTVIINAKDGASDLRSTYVIPDSCDADGNIDFPKISAALQNDLDKLTKEVGAIKQQIAAPRE